MNEKDKKEYGEKEEKAEKEVLKHEEKVEQRDQLSAATWAVILIWAGFIFLAFNTGWIDRLIGHNTFSRFLPDGLEMFDPGVWSIIMLGSGLILILESILRLALPKFHRNIGGSLITGAVFIGVGLGGTFGWDLVWPVVLIAIGISVLVGGLFRK